MLKFVYQSSGNGKRLKKMVIVAAVSLASGSAFAQAKLPITSANVSASASDSNVPSNANDGSLATRWSADATSSAQWLKYNLSGCYRVASFNLSWYNGDSRIYDITLQTSLDGSSWATAWTGHNSGTSAALKPYDITETSAKYVRLLSNGSNVNKFVSVNEMEVISNGPGTCGSSLDPNKPPGGNFSLSAWSLQLPIGTSGSVTTKSGADLEAGYTNQYYFYTDSNDGSMVMMDPSKGYATGQLPGGSSHPRTEMRETALWDPSGTNTLTAQVAVTKVPKNTTIAQIFVGSGPASKPLCELQVHSNGDIALFLENTDADGTGSTTPIISNVPIGQRFTYILTLTGTKLTVKINDEATKSYTIDSSFSNDRFYFKAGDYDQSAVRIDSGSVPTTDSTVVKYYALAIHH